MAAKPETTFTSSVHRHLPPKLYFMKNNNPFNSGIADVWYSGQVTDLWIEYKFIVVPKRGETMIDLVGGKDPMLSHLQQAWLKQRCEEGRNVAVIVGCREGGVWFPAKKWVRPMTTTQFMAGIMSRTALAQNITTFVQGAK